MKNYDFNFQTGKKSMYHTMKNVKSIKLDSGVTLIKECIMTGLCKGLKVGDVIYLDKNHKSMEVVEIIEQRDHSGVFSNNEDRVNAYFKARFKNVG